MSTTRWTAGCISLVLLAPASPGQGKPDQPKRVEPPTLSIPSGPPITLDGRIADGEWNPAAVFTVDRGRQNFGQGWLRRVDRQLMLGYRSAFSSYSLGLRFMFTDPISQRRTLVLVTPIHPPAPPLTIYREMPGRQPEREPSSECDVRFELSSEEGFTMELRLPLDLVEFGRSAKSYAFSMEVWDLAQHQMLSAYPLKVEGAVGGKGRARFVPDKDWGVDVPLDRKPPPPSEALDLLDRIDAETTWFRGGQKGPKPPPVLVGFLGDRDGQRKEAPLLALEKKLRRLVALYPDYLSLRANLMRALRGRNRFREALAVLETIPRDFPVMKRNLRNVFVKVELLFNMGRYHDVLTHIAQNRELLDEAKATDNLTRMFEAMSRNWELEQAIRKRDADRDDLPRVLIKTNKGDILIELYEDDAPNGVANFITLVESGAYDGTKFHWVASSGRVFGGDSNSRNENPHDDGFGDPGYLIESQPGRRLQLPFTVAYADKRFQRRTEGSTFVIHITPIPDLDGFNTVFGRVIEGQDVVRTLEYYDAIISAKVIRKRAHEYTVVKRPTR